jgi:hypothetical protein
MGEEEATMRERLVEAMARALYEQFAADDISCTYCSWELLGDKQSWRDRALPALDAALDVLETPSEEMVAQYTAKQGAILDDTFGSPSSHDHAAGRTEQSREQFQQILGILLATLRSPKI